jgi:hypothetical protein
LELKKGRPERFVTVFTELEKVGVFQYLQEVAGPILANEADVVTPGR